MRSHTQESPGTTSAQTSPPRSALPDSPTAPPNGELPPANTRGSGGVATAAGTEADGLETRVERLRRYARRGRLHGYAIAIIAFLAILIALAATNTSRVHVDWILGSSRVSLVWLVLAAAIIGWILGVLTSTRFQWLTRSPHPRPLHRNSGRE